MKALANPVLMRAAVVLVCSACAFLLTLLFMRRLRRSISEDLELLADPTPSLETLPLHLYNTVIQQLKQQKHELHAQSRIEQQRARISETLSQAVLANLSSGVLVLGANGLVRTANSAAKEILGFASATGMSAADIFRDARVKRSGPREVGVFSHETTDGVPNDDLVSAEVEAVLHEGSQRRQVEAEYSTPAGKTRFLAVTISPVAAASDGSLLGVACLINDVSAMEDIRREQELQGELSAEMALQLRASVATISGYAQQLAAGTDAAKARQIANDIAQEAAELECSVGSFLTQKRGGQVMATGASATRA